MSSCNSEVNDSTADEKSLGAGHKNASHSYLFGITARLALLTAFAAEPCRIYLNVHQEISSQNSSPSQLTLAGSVKTSKVA